MVTDMIKCECCDNLMDTKAYDQHWFDRQRIDDLIDHNDRFEAALLIIAATDNGTPAQIAKKVLHID